MTTCSKKKTIDLEDFKYTATHEWLYVEGNIVTIGVTEIVTRKLGSIVYLDLPEIDDEILTIVPFGEIESVDDTYDVNCPVEGETTEVNEILMNKLDILDTDPYKKGWLLKLFADDVAPIADLMSKEEYERKFSINLNSRKRKPKLTTNRK